MKGKSQTINKLIQYCKYDYVALLDVDDIWNPSKLEIQIQPILLSNYDVIGTNCMLFGDKPGMLPKIPMGDISDVDFTILNPIINSSVIIKKELCYCDETIPALIDYEMWLRIRHMNKTFYNCPEVVVFHRIHKQSAFNSKGNQKYRSMLLRKYKKIQQDKIQQDKNKKIQ